MIMNRKNKNTSIEWSDPYEFLVTIKKEPNLSSLALADLELSDQTIESTNIALDSYLNNIFEVIKDKLISITTPPLLEENVNDNTTQNIYNNVIKNQQQNLNQFRPIISKDDLNLTFDKIKLDIVSYTTDLLNDRFRSDRFTLLNHKKKIAEQIETNRNAAQQFRKDYDVSARNRHEESIRVLQQYETDKYTEETSRLRKIIKDLEHSQSALLKKLSGLEDEKNSLNKSLKESNAAVLKVSTELKAMKDAKRKQNRGGDLRLSMSEPEHSVASQSPVSTPGASERKSSMASRSSKDLSQMVNSSPPTTPSTPLAKNYQQIQCQKCTVYEEDIKNLKTLVIQLTNVNTSTINEAMTTNILTQRSRSRTAELIDDSRPQTAELLDNSRPQTAELLDNSRPQTVELLIDQSQEIASIENGNADVPTVSAIPLLPAAAIEPTTLEVVAEEAIKQEAETKSTIIDGQQTQIEESISSISNESDNKTSNDIISAKDNIENDTDNVNSKNINSENNAAVPPQETTVALVSTEVAQSESIMIESNNESTPASVVNNNKNADRAKVTTPSKSTKSKQPEEVSNLDTSDNQQGYLGFGPTSKDLKKGKKGQQEVSIPKILETYSIASISSTESNMVRPSSSLSEYNMRPSTTLSDMSRDDRITEDLYDLARGRGLLSHDALQKINRKNEILIQEYQTKMLSLEYQIRNLSKRVRSDEVFMEKLEYINALKLQERDILLTTVCNQLKKLKEEKESVARLKKFAVAEMALQMPRQNTLSKKTLPLPNIKFDIPQERESSPQSSSLVLSNSMPNLPYSRYLESLQPTKLEANVIPNRSTSPDNIKNSLILLEQKANDNHDRGRPRIPITDELYGDEGIEKLLKSDPDALYEYRNIRKQILNLVIEHTPSKPRKKALDISLRKPFHP